MLLHGDIVIGPESEPSAGINLMKRLTPDARCSTDRSDDAFAFHPLNRMANQFRAAFEPKLQLQVLAV